MNNKKYLAWFINSTDEKAFNKFVLVNNLLIKKISEKFEKVYMINVEKLKFFSKRKIDSISYGHCIFYSISN